MISFMRLPIVLMSFLTALGCSPTQTQEQKGQDMPQRDSNQTTETEVATLGAGCYWCVEAVLQQVEGVTNVVSGFMGGIVDDPSYEDVCSGLTGHAEVVQVRFDPKKVSYSKILDWFWQLHDPTQKDRQGADRGTQYRSAIFFHSESQRAAAIASKEAEDKSGRHPAPIVTEIVQASKFFAAKSDHQDYYQQNRTAGYCRAVIAPKLKKLGLKN